MSQPPSPEPKSRKAGWEATARELGLADPNVTTGDEEPGSADILHKALEVVLRHKLLLLAVTALAVGTAMWWLKHQTPIYRATANVIIDSKTPKVLTNVREVVELGGGRDFWSLQKFWGTQQEIIKSHMVAERVLDRLDLWNSEHLLGLDAPDNTMTRQERTEKLEKAHMPTVLARRISVSAVQDSMLFRISFEDSDPALAAAVANAVAEAYQEQNVDYKRRVVSDATADLEKMAARAGGELRAAEDEAQRFEETHEAGSIANSKKMIEERLARLNRQVDEAAAARANMEARVRSLEAHADTKDVFAVSATPVLQSATVSTIKERMFVVQAELESLKARYLDKHPEVQAKRRELHTLGSSARREIKSLVESARADLIEARTIEVGLKAKIARTDAEEQLAVALERQYSRLIDARDQKKDMHSGISKRLNEAKMSTQVENNNIRILEPAVVPAVPVYPRKLIVIAIAVLLGLMLGTAVAFWLDYSDSTIKGWESLAALTGLKVLGVLPVIKQQVLDRETSPVKGFVRERDLHAYEHPKSRVAEAYRTLRTNLQFVASVRNVHTLLVTSSDPGEGKSTVCVNTALSMALAGRRVLIIEADMRRPRLARSFQLDEDLGLSSFLVMDDEDPTEHIQTGPVEHLDVMTSGAVPPNPAELLQTERFTALLDYAREHYDMVVIDSPPVLPVSDPLILARQVDGVLAVVLAGRTSRFALQDSLRRLRGIGAPMLGLVLNQLTEPRRRYGRGYRRYGYGYGYGGYGGYGYAADASDES